MARRRRRRKNRRNSCVIPLGLFILGTAASFVYFKTRDHASAHVNNMSAQQILDTTATVLYAPTDPYITPETLATLTHTPLPTLMPTHTPTPQPTTTLDIVVKAEIPPLVEGSPVTHLRWIDPGVLAAGAQPDSAAAFDYLQAQGFKTVIDLSQGMPNERSLVEQRGMIYIDKYPMNAESPTHHDFNKNILEIMTIIKDPAMQPVYVHCQHGAHRAGMIVGIYRVEFENYSYDLAEKEMLRFANNSYPYQHLKDAVKSYSPDLGNIDIKHLISTPTPVPTLTHTPRPTEESQGPNNCKPRDEPIIIKNNGNYTLFKFDLCSPYINVGSSAPGGLNTAQGYANSHNVIFTVNADQWDSGSSVPKGPYVHRNHVHAGNPREPSLVVYENGRVTIRHINSNFDGILYAVSGNNTLFNRSNYGGDFYPDIKQDCHSPKWGSRGRTVIGVNDNTLFVMITQPMTLCNAAEIMDNIGAHSAINMDAGGSQQIYFNGRLYEYTWSGRSVVNFATVHYDGPDELIP